LKKSIYSKRQGLVTKRLVELRHKAGLTQRELAKRLLVWPATIASVEKGQRRMDLLELCDYIKGCNASPEKVLVALLRACAKIKE
jgi:transcriptional regulator with XRE-family HTH domain